MTNDLTAVYYTAHLERPEIEEAVRQTHLENCGEVPIISVSQRPLDFGTNICVGQVGVSDLNAFRQLEIGVQAAQTKYICNIEADFVYPPEYFLLRPQRDDAIYISYPLYVLFCMAGKHRRFYLKPTGSEGSIVVARDYILAVLKEMMDGCPEWSPESHPFKHMYVVANRMRSRLRHPVVTFKTDQNMGRKTPFSSRSMCMELPYWGTVHDVCVRYHLPEHIERHKA